MKKQEKQIIGILFTITLIFAYAAVIVFASGYSRRESEDSTTWVTPQLYERITFVMLFCVVITLLASGLYWCYTDITVRDNT